MTKRETGKEKTKKTKTPEEMAREFWADTYAKIQERITESILNGEPSEEREHYIQFVQKLKQLPPDSPVGSFDELIINHKFLVEPYLDWDKIKSIFNNLDVDDKAIRLIVFILKPTLIEYTIVPNEYSIVQSIEKACKAAIDDCNKKIRSLSPLVKKLEKLVEEDEYRHVLPIRQTIMVLQENIQLYKALVKDRKENDKKLLNIYLIDKDLKKSPQKHKYWNEVVAHALKIINPYCHTGDCDRQCRKTHSKAIIKIAELLKVLYPSIWKEDVNIIANRIKQKDYRKITI